jgi:hypothetical protein
MVVSLMKIELGVGKGYGNSAPSDNAQPWPKAIGWSEVLTADNFIQALNDASEVFGINGANFLADAFS